MRETRFAQMHVHVDETRRDERAARIDDARIADLGMLDDLA